MSLELTDHQKADKFRNRRRFAWISFLFITLFGSGLIIYGVVSPDVAANISAMSFIIGTVFGVWASIVLSYVGAATLNQMNERKYDAQTGQVVHSKESFETEMDDNR